MCFSGTLTGLARSGRNVLLAQGFDYLIGRYIIGQQLIRLQPNPHGIIFLAHDLGTAYPIDTLQFLKDIDIGKVVNKVFVCIVIGTGDVEVHQHTVYLFLGGYPGFDHLFGQLIQHGGDAVLHIYRCNVGISTNFEVNGNHSDAVIARNGGHIGHTWYAIDGLL
ncbi:hypothetical protein D3C86_1452710 [compost metagenome]